MSTAEPGPFSDEAFFREKVRRDAHRLFKANGESKLEYLFVAKDSNGRVISKPDINPSSIESMKKRGKNFCAARRVLFLVNVSSPANLIVSSILTV